MSANASVLFRAGGRTCLRDEVMLCNPAGGQVHRRFARRKTPRRRGARIRSAVGRSQRKGSNAVPLMTGEQGASRCGRLHSPERAALPSEPATARLSPHYRRDHQHAPESLQAGYTAQGSRPTRTQPGRPDASVSEQISLASLHGGASSETRSGRRARDPHETRTSWSISSRLRCDARGSVRMCAAITAARHLPAALGVYGVDRAHRKFTEWSLTTLTISDR